MSPELWGSVFLKSSRNRGDIPSVSENYGVVTRVQLVLLDDTLFEENVTPQVQAKALEMMSMALAVDAPPGRLK